MTAFVDVPMFPDCVLPGCSVPVAVVGQPCDGCRAAFGHMLQPTSRPALTADQIHERDHSTRHAQAVMAELGASHDTQISTDGGST